MSSIVKLPPLTLAPCPWCRERPSVTDIKCVSLEDAEAMQVICQCGACGPFADGDDAFDTPENAALAWNRRAPTTK